MRIFDFKKINWDIKFLIAFAITFLIGIISGIVLFKLSIINYYFYDYADIYVFYVFNFNNGTLFFSHLISELFYLYIIFAIVYFTKLKFLSLILVFIKSLFIVIYCAILCSMCGFAGTLVTILVFIPISLISFVLYLFMIESCKIINKKYVLFFPAILALSNCIILLILVNVLFRIVIIIV